MSSDIRYELSRARVTELRRSAATHHRFDEPTSARNDHGMVKHHRVPVFLHRFVNRAATAA